MMNVDCDPVLLTEDWFTECKQRFKGLSSTQKTAVILNLIEICDTSARFNLLKFCNQALQCDILASMPQIALDKILDLLPVPDMLNACKVSHQWNRSISQSKFVWKKKWLDMGIGSCWDLEEFKERDWKEDCVIAQGLHSQIEGQKALDYNLDLYNFSSSLGGNYGYISALDFCNDKLVLCHSHREGGSVLSQTENESIYLCSFPVMNHGNPSCVRLLPSNLLVVGTSNGKVTIWRFCDLKSGFIHHEVILLHACHGHSGVVLNVDGCDEIGLAVSGSRDARVKVWCIASGKCVKTLDFSSPVLQVSFFCGESSLLKEYDFMLIHSSEKIFLLSWRWHANWLKDSFHEQCIVTDANILPGINIKNGYLYYCSITMAGCDPQQQRTDFNCKQLNLTAVVGKGKGSPFCDGKTFSFPGTFRKLLRVGSVFSLIIADDKVMAIDVRNGSVLFKGFVPYSAATSPILPQIAVGLDSWLNGLLYVKRSGMLLALAIYGRNLALISWGSSLPEFPSNGTNPFLHYRKD